MGHKLTPSTMHDFLSRFDHGYDGVIRRFYVEMPDGARKYAVVVVIYIRDAESGWVELQLMFERVSEYRLTGGDVDYTQILSDGLSVVFTPDKIYMDFTSDVSDDVSAARRSAFYVGAKSCRWQIAPAESPRLSLSERLSSFFPKVKKHKAR